MEMGVGLIIVGVGLILMPALVAWLDQLFNNLDADGDLREMEKQFDEDLVHWLMGKSLPQIEMMRASQLFGFLVLTIGVCFLGVK